MVTSADAEPTAIEWHFRFNSKQPAIFAKRDYLYDEWNVQETWKQTVHSWYSNVQWEEHSFWWMDCSDRKKYPI